MGTPLNSNGLIPIYFIDSNEIKLVEKIVKTDEEWKKILSPEQFNVARK
jgi:peptide-methionine (R)-S-oxide reductase